jgi:hypothetical protein
MRDEVVIDEPVGKPRSGKAAKAPTPYPYLEIKCLKGVMAELRRKLKSKARPNARPPRQRYICKRCSRTFAPGHHAWSGRGLRKG